MALTGIYLAGNAARYSTGGAANYGTMTVSASTVSGNTAGGTGGGIDNGGTLTLIDSTVEGNTADAGGGGQNSSDLTLINSTISGNTAADRGGGLYNGNAMTLTNSTVSRNASGRLGGGLFNTGALTLIQSLLSGNTAPLNGSEAYNIASQSGGGTVVADGFNVLGHDGSSGAAGFTLGATDRVPAVPLSDILDPSLGYNGGGLRTHALVFGSPAVDAVPGAACATAADQRRAPRPQDGDGDNFADCDIGAVERGLIAVQAAITSTRLDCRRAGCRVPVRCNLTEASCTNAVEVTVYRSRRNSDGTVTKAARPMSFAAGVANIPPGGSGTVSLKLTKPGKQTHAGDQEKEPEGPARHPGDRPPPSPTRRSRSATPPVTLRLKRR